MKSAYVLAALVACGEPDPPKPSPGDEVKTDPKPAPEPAATDHGSCTVKVGGALTLEQTSPGGPSKTIVSYWDTQAEKVGLVLNCTGKQLNLNILTKHATKASVPFGPKRYLLEQSGKDTLYVIGTIGKTSVTGATGTIEITQFDASRIAGTLDLKGRTLPGDEEVTLTGSFDFKCPGVSGCAK
jgi:hypothetical protein